MYVLTSLTGETGVSGQYYECKGQHHEDKGSKGVLLPHSKKILKA